MKAKNVIIPATTHYTKFSPTCKHVQSKVTYESLRVHQFTVWQVGKGGEECDHSSSHSLHTKFNPTCKPVHSKVLTSWECTSSQCGKSGKEAKNVIIQVTTHCTKFSPTCKHVHSKVTYFLRVHQFTVRQVGKEGKECDHSSSHSLHTKFSPTCKYVLSKVTYSLRVHQLTVRQVGKRRKIAIAISQGIIHHTNSILSMHKPVSLKVT